jgi:hypothetical protein
VAQAADIDMYILDQRVQVVFPNARKGSAKIILLSFENNSGESVEQSTEFLTERAKDSESKG